MAKALGVLTQADITETVYDSANRKIVLVEGPSDVEILESWYEDRLTDVEFFAVGGQTAVQFRLNEMLALSLDKEIYEIIDRDFRDDDEVTESRKPESHLFVLLRYSIDNYLIEPAAVFDVARSVHERPAFANVQAIEREILRLCLDLKNMMATNWLLIDTEEESFHDRFQILKRAEYVTKLTTVLNCNETDADRLLSGREAKIDAILGSLNTAHTRISGKHLLQQVYMSVTKTQKGIHKDIFRRLLRDSVPRTCGIDPDIREIVEGRILKLPPVALAEASEQPA